MVGAGLDCRDRRLTVAETGADSEQRMRALLLGLIEGYRATAVCHVAARLGIADLLRDGPMDAGELAVAAEAHGPSLLRLLRGLTVLGIVEEAGPGRFQLTALGMLLRRDAPLSLRRTALRSGDEMEMRIWGCLLHAVKTGETAFDHVYGMGSFEYLARNPTMSAGFNRAMVAATRDAAPTLLAAYDFSQFRRIVDVGGGSGAFIAAILQAHTGVQGVVFDTRAGVEGAAALIEAAGLAGRCEVVAGDFFADELPAGADCYVVKSVIDDWDDERTVALLRSCRRAIPPSGRLVVIGPVMPERVEPSERVNAVVMFDLEMLVSSGGRERTRAELEGLFASAGFELTEVMPTAASFPYSVIEGMPN